jgi:hypothetical protein
MSRLDELNVLARSFDKSAVVLVKEDSWFMKFLNIFVRVFNKNFMTEYTITIGNRVYMTQANMDRECGYLIAHEVGGHVRQCRYFGFGIHPWVGFLFYMIAYLFLVFPTQAAYLRYRLELAADAVAWRYALDHGMTADWVRARAVAFANKVSSWDYFQSWPDGWTLWGFQRKAEKVIQKWSAEHV